MFFLIAETFTLLIFAIAFGAILGWWLRYALSTESDAETSAAAPSTAEADSDQSKALAECEAETTELNAQLEALKVELDKSQQQCRRCQHDLAEKDAELTAATAANDSSNGNSTEADTMPNSLLGQHSDKQDAAASQAMPESTNAAEDTKSEGDNDSEPAALFSVDLAAKPADNLQKISGVGPKLSGLLNELGVYHFSQIANFNDDDIARVNKRLSFTGRIEREKWVEQAKVLAEGGETEFSKRKT